MELTSKQKGNLTELQCLTAFVAEGCGVSIPYGDNSKYDFKGLETAYLSTFSSYSQVIHTDLCKKIDVFVKNCNNNM